MRFACQLLSLREFFQIDALDPSLQFAGLLVLQLDLEKVTVGDHYPQSGMLTFVLERFKSRVAIDRDRFAVTFAAFAVAVPRSGGGSDIIRISNRIEYANRRIWRFVPFALVIVAVHVCDSESAHVFGGTLGFISGPALRRFR